LIREKLKWTIVIGRYARAKVDAMLAGTAHNHAAAIEEVLGTWLTFREIDGLCLAAIIDVQTHEIYDDGM
jgi:hypothetical protein